MIRTLLATTAIATIVATGAYAQTAPMAPMEQSLPNVVHAEGHLASNIIGKTVYSSPGDDADNIGSINDLVISSDGDVEAVVIGVGGFLGIGRKDVAIDYNLVDWVERDGDRWVVINTSRDALEALPDFDTSAFRPMPPGSEIGHTAPATASDLGLPEPEPVAADDGVSADDDLAEAPAGETMTAEDDLAAAPADDVTTDDDDLAAAPADETAPADDLATAPADDATTAQDDLATAPADEAAPADDLAVAPADDATTAQDDLAVAPADETATVQDDVAQAPTDDALGTDDTPTAAIDPSGLTDRPVAGMSADDFIGTTVYGANDENVGSVSDIILSQDGQVEAVIIDVGGFLGIGAKPVAVGLDNLAFLSDAGGSTYLYTQFTREQLDAQPEYDPATFAEHRDQQLLIVPAQ